MSNISIPCQNEGVLNVRSCIETFDANLAKEPLVALPLIGTDNQNYRIGNSHLFRQPLSEDTGIKLIKETEILPLFEGLNLKVPQPLKLGFGSDEGRNPWGIFSWIEGADGGENVQIDSKENAIALGKFLHSMRQLPPLAQNASGEQNNRRGMPLAEVSQGVRDSIKKVDDEFDVSALNQIWDDALAAPAHLEKGKWLHGDLHAANLLFDEKNKICAVIDWGLAGVGDPAADLAAGWWIFSSETRRHFFNSAGADESEIRRGRGWALHNAVIAYAYYRDKDKALLNAMSRAAILALQDELRNR